jgi:hypothetical protein
MANRTKLGIQLLATGVIAAVVFGWANQQGLGLFQSGVIGLLWLIIGLLLVIVTLLYQKE